MMHSSNIVINSLNTELFDLQQSLQNTEEDEEVNISQNSQENEY